MELKSSRFIKMICMAVSLLFLTGCPGLADYSIDLPGNYSVVRTSGHQIFLAAQEEEGHWGRTLIPAKVTNVGWDDIYIVAKQVDLVDDPKSNNGYQIPDEGSYHFWIVKIGSHAVFGPLNDDEYEAKKKELGIEEEIVLKDVEDLK